MKISESVLRMMLFGAVGSGALTTAALVGASQHANAAEPGSGVAVAAPPAFRAAATATPKPTVTPKPTETPKPAATPKPAPRPSLGPDYCPPCGRG